MGQSDTQKATFGTKLYSKLALKDGNVFFSPYSIVMALGMTVAGARGETRKVLCSLLGCPETDTDAYFKKLVDGVNNGKKLYDLITANALWGNSGFKFDESFKINIKDNYGGSFNEVDYKNNPMAAVSLINAWVSEKTKGLIPTLITISDVNKETRLVLTNAIYFKGKWEEPFDKARTVVSSFYGKQKTTDVPLMHMTVTHPYYETDGFQAVDLPYLGDDLSMLVVLPYSEKGEVSFSTLESRWDDSSYEQACRGLYSEELKLYLPRFKVEASFALGSTLSELGAGLAFSDDANFSGISEEPLKISQVIHKAFVECDEEGTKAAAATAVGMMRCASFRQQSKSFRADRPFMFFIRNKNTNQILFQGRITDL